MRKILPMIVICLLLAVPVHAMEYTAPEAPEDAQELMPSESTSFGADLWKIITSAVEKLEPDLAHAALTCFSVFAVVMLVSVIRSLPGRGAQTADFAGVIGTALLLLQSTNTMVDLASDTITELSEYGKLLIPVMSASLAAQGGLTSSAALYAGTAVFDSLLVSGISNLLVPMVYVFLVLAIAAGATGQQMLTKLRDFVKWLVTWCLKTILYVFTGYISITGVISGTADAATIKATKLTMSGMIPVVGGILSDASEAVIAGAAVMKSTVGVYGLLAVSAIWISPFLEIGIQYLLLKLTAALCGMFETKMINDVVSAFSAAMGLLLGMTGSVCVLLLVSTVCFMKGVG